MAVQSLCIASRMDNDMQGIYTFFKCRNVGLSDIHSVRYRYEQKCRCLNQSGTGIRGPSPVPHWDTGCRNADAGGIDLDADAQPWINHTGYARTVICACQIPSAGRKSYAPFKNKSKSNIYWIVKRINAGLVILLSGELLPLFAGNTAAQHLRKTPLSLTTATPNVGFHWH